MARDAFGSAKTATAPDIIEDAHHFLDAARIVATRYAQWDDDIGTEPA